MKNNTTFVRVEKNRNYTTIHNEFLKRKDLSWKAKGIMTYLLSLPDDWVVNLDEIKRNATDGESSFRSGWKELVSAGYVSRQPVRDEKTKKIDYWETVIKESISKDKSHNVENHNVGIHQVGNHKVDNRELLSTKELSTNKPITNIQKEHQPSDDGQSTFERFEVLWKEYPKKQGKKKALTYYKRAIKNGVTDEVIMQGIEDYKKYLDSEKNKGWLNPMDGSRWFNEERWNDEYDDIEANQSSWAGSDF